MIDIRAEGCSGCGACVGVCPAGALYLVEGKAMVEHKLCRDCESCIAACPMEAISLITPKEAVAEPVRVAASCADLIAMVSDCRSGMSRVRYGCVATGV